MTYEEYKQIVKSPLLAGATTEQELEVAKKRIEFLTKEYNDQETETFITIGKLMKIRRLLSVLEYVPVALRVEVDSIIGPEILRLGVGGNA